MCLARNSLLGACLVVKRMAHWVSQLIWCTGAEVEVEAEAVVGVGDMEEVAGDTAVAVAAEADMSAGDIHVALPPHLPCLSRHLPFFGVSSVPTTKCAVITTIL